MVAHANTLSCQLANSPTYKIGSSLTFLLLSMISTTANSFAIWSCTCSTLIFDIADKHLLYHLSSKLDEQLAITAGCAVLQCLFLLLHNLQSNSRARRQASPGVTLLQTHSATSSSQPRAAAPHEAGFTTHHPQDLAFIGKEVSAHILCRNAVSNHT